MQRSSAWSKHLNRPKKKKFNQFRSILQWIPSKEHHQVARKKDPLTLGCIKFRPKIDSEMNKICSLIRSRKLHIWPEKARPTTIASKEDMLQYKKEIKDQLGVWE